MNDLSIRKDQKGPSYFVSHKRCGMTEGLWLTYEELVELKRLLEETLL